MDVDLGPFDPRDFTKVYDIMEEAFPPSEIWSYERTKALVNEPDYKILCVKSKKERLAGFLAIRGFPTFNFAEYFAIKRSLRGKGFGSAALKCYIEQTAKPLILEVEAHNNRQAKRRIKFYENLGFILNDLSYIQPPVRPNDPPVPLQIMSHPDPVPKNKENRVKRQIFQRVYQLAI